jgi:hypothetical protein
VILEAFGDLLAVLLDLLSSPLVLFQLQATLRRSRVDLRSVPTKTKTVPRQHTPLGGGKKRREAKNEARSAYLSSQSSSGSQK